MAAASTPASSSEPRLILASASPRRRELLREAGYAFTVEAAGVDEDEYPPQLLPSELARHLAAAKARVVARRYPDAVVLGADTVVAFGDTPIGKADDIDDARRILQLLSGTTHIVITGVAVRCARDNLEIVRCALSAVRMRVLTTDQIETYLATGEWRGKAGAYGIQDDDPFVTRMAGSHSNIVGLPMELTARMLQVAGIAPASSPSPVKSHFGTANPQFPRPLLPRRTP